MKIKHIIATCFFTILLFSCSEDFITIPSSSALSTPVYFKTQTDFEGAVNGIYNPMSAFFGSTSPNFAINGTANHLQIGDMHSDNARYYYNPSYRATITQENIADFVPVSTLFSDYWNTFYSWITRTNDVISRIDGATFDQAVKDNLKGQALFFRAYSYWWLARVFGDACIHLVPVTTVEGASKPLSPVADVLSQAITDATLASTLLMNKATQTAGRVTSGTAKMLLADIYMWQKQWALAEAQLTGLSTEYSLMPNYADITNPASKNNAESIFEIQFSNASSTFSHNVPYTMVPIPFRSDSIKALTGVSDPQSMSAGEGMCIPTPDLISKYVTGDKRKAVTIKRVHDANGVSVPMCVKYLHSHSLYQQSGDNMPVYRYAEALLFLAEAVNEQGGRSSVALGYLNQVRTRAGLANSTASTQADIRDAILNERQVELAFEGKRWFDLVRTGNVQSVIGAYGAKVKANPLNYYFSAGISPVPSSFTAITTTFNLPDNERLYNTFLRN
jgi:hypothetical protein